MSSSNAYSMTGTGHCFAAGRLSYALGLHGASEAIDTACSSALVACHNARQSVQLHECQHSLLAGVNLVSTSNLRLDVLRALTTDEDAVRLLPAP